MQLPLSITLKISLLIKMVTSRSVGLKIYFIFVSICLMVGRYVEAAPKISYQENNFAQRYLKQYHYLSPLRDGNHDWQTAIRTFQRYMHLPVTGELDLVTLREMHKPRCGVPDMEDEVDFGPNSGVIEKRYQFTAEKWNKTSLNYAFESTGDDLPASTVRAIFQKAFKLWSDASVLTFTEVTDLNTADIKIRFVKGAHYPCSYDFDQQGGILAHAFFPKSGIIHFDDDETFTDNTPTGTNLLSVATHEIGHVLGLHHSSEPNALMNSEYHGYIANLALHEDDVKGIQTLYATANTGSTQTTGSKCGDKMSNCHQYKYLCGTITMKDNCPDTCGLCGGASVVAPKCIDVYSSQRCNRLNSTYGLCTSSKHRKLMQLRCKKTCSFCGSG